MRTLPALRQRGISLIEAVLYLVIALAVIVGGIIYFNQAQLSSNVTDTSRNAVGISSQVRGLYNNQKSFDGVDDATLISAGLVPANLDAGDGTIDNDFNGKMTVAAADVDGTADGFTFTFSGFSEAGCARLAQVSADGQGPLGVDIASIKIGEAAADVDGVSPSDAAALCDDDLPVTVTYAR